MTKKIYRGVRRIEDKEIAAKRRKKPSAATRNQNKDLTEGGCEGNGMTGRGIFGRGMGNRPCRELFLCRTFPCRFLLNTSRPEKAVVMGMIVRGIIVPSLLPNPLTIIPMTNLLECGAKRPVVVRLLRFLAAIPLASCVVYAADFSVSPRNRVKRLLKNMTKSQ
jgi:hypothetical protein